MLRSDGLRSTVANRRHADRLEQRAQRLERLSR
jgi:hypothetical protein